MAQDTKYYGGEIDAHIEAAVKAERERIMAIVKKAVPAMEHWPCWKEIEAKNEETWSNSNPDRSGTTGQSAGG